jgi:hypothetical protein
VKFSRLRAALWFLMAACSDNSRSVSIHRWRSQLTPRGRFTSLIARTPRGGVGRLTNPGEPVHIRPRAGRARRACSVPAVRLVDRAERALLISVAGGVTGWNFGITHTRPPLGAAGECSARRRVSKDAAGLSGGRCRDPRFAHTGVARGARR